MVRQGRQAQRAVLRGRPSPLQFEPALDAIDALVGARSALGASEAGATVRPSADNKGVGE